MNIPHAPYITLNVSKRNQTRMDRAFVTSVRKQCVINTRKQIPGHARHVSETSLDRNECGLNKWFLVLDKTFSPIRPPTAPTLIFLLFTVYMDDT